MFPPAYQRAEGGRNPTHRLHLPLRRWYAARTAQRAVRYLVNLSGSGTQSAIVSGNSLPVEGRGRITRASVQSPAFLVAFLPGRDSRIYRFRIPAAFDLSPCDG